MEIFIDGWVVLRRVGLFIEGGWGIVCREMAFCVRETEEDVCCEERAFCGGEWAFPRRVGEFLWSNGTFSNGEMTGRVEAFCGEEGRFVKRRGVLWRRGAFC